ncbi:MAG: YceI family protein, partial [Armatimonadetes bacterium]|nr:YceI family protein [Armatimonadota bacterium]
MNFKSLATLTLSSIVAAGAFAQSQTFAIGPVGGSGATQTFNVESDAQFENFTGHTNKVSGAIQFDPAKGTGSGTMTIDLSSIDTGIALRNEHMRSSGWLDTEKFPKAVFVT